MTKAGDKLLGAAKEAVKVAKCDHELWEQSMPNDSALRQFYCRKCKATIWLGTAAAVFMQYPCAVVRALIGDDDDEG